MQRSGLRTWRSIVVATFRCAGDSFWDLTTLIGERQPLPADTAVRYVADICDALSHARARGVVRDIKPGNVLVDGGRAHLAGLASRRPFLARRRVAKEVRDQVA